MVLRGEIEKRAMERFPPSELYTKIHIVKYIIESLPIIFQNMPWNKQIAIRQNVKVYVTNQIWSLTHFNPEVLVQRCCIILGTSGRSSWSCLIFEHDTVNKITKIWYELQPCVEFQSTLRSQLFIIFIPILNPKLPFVVKTNAEGLIVWIICVVH